MMKIKAIYVPPVDPKHGITRGRIYSAVWEGAKKKCVIIVSDTGENVTLLPHEFDLVPQPKELTHE